MKKKKKIMEKDELEICLIKAEDKLSKEIANNNIISKKNKN